MLAAEPAPALAADRVAPHDLVDEPVAPEQPIERDLHVVDGAVVEVDEQRAGRRERAPASRRAAARATRRTHPDRPRDRRSCGRGRAGPCRCRTADRCRSRRATPSAHARRAVERIAQTRDRAARHRPKSSRFAPRPRRYLMRREILSVVPARGGRRPRAGRREGVLQLRVAEGLLDYPRGKSAMVHYEHARDVAPRRSRWPRRTRATRVCGAGT